MRRLGSQANTVKPLAEVIVELTEEAVPPDVKRDRADA